jgi:ABC-type branched-subunit amino acid transport system substrate-binding protein
MLIAVVVIPHHEDTTTAGSAALRAAGQADASDSGSSGGSASEPIGEAATGDQPAATSGAAAGGTTAGTDPTATSSSGATVDNTKLPNAGATARGVTAKEIVIGVASVDPSVLAPVCPKCDPGQANTGAPAQALVEAWTRDHLVPVNGRAIKVVNRKVGLTADEQRSACTYFAQQLKPFLVVTGAGTSGVGVCLANQYKIPVLDPYGGYKEVNLEQNYPFIQIVAPSVPRLVRNWVYWAEDNGLLKGHKIGMVSFDDSAGTATGAALGVENTTEQAILTRDFRNVLTKRGYSIAVDAVLRDPTANDSAPHIAEMKAQGVDVVFSVLGAYTKTFQDSAGQQGFHPKYPSADLAYLFGEGQGADAVNHDEEDGNLGMAVRWWNPSRRSPPGAADNKYAQYCFDAYGAFTKKKLDTYTQDSELHLTLDICTGMEVLRTALAAAGANLTVERYLGGLQSIKNLPTSEFPSVSFAPGKYSGSDSIATAQFRKSRFQPSNDLWGFVSPWRAMYVQ